MEDLVQWLVALALALLLGYGFGRWRRSPAAATGPAPVDRLRPADGSDELYQVAGQLSPVFDAAARPADLVEHPSFLQGIEILKSKAGSVDALIGYYRGESLVLACLALEVLAGLSRQERDVREPILESINDYATFNRYFAFRVLEAHTKSDESLIPRVLARIDDSWSWPQNLRVLEEFLRRRMKAGDKLEVDRDIEGVPAEAADELSGVLQKLPDDVGAPLRESLKAWRGRRVDVDLLDSIGRVWKDGAPVGSEGRVLEHAALAGHLAIAQNALSKEPRSSILLVGEHGVGKTALVRALSPRLREQGWYVFEAGQAELLAGQTYMGQLEERMRTLIDALRDRQVLWFVPDFHTLALAGRHRYGPLSVLDILLPCIESGELVVLGETSSTAFEQLVQSKPGVLTAMETHRILPLPEAATRDLVARWAEDRVSGDEGLSPDTRNEAWLLAQQYLGDRAAPGNVLKLLDLTRQRLATASAKGQVRIRQQDLIATLTQLTGLPASILDDRQGLDLEALRAAFETRVMGQPEATDCLVERVAMIKAGVSDPSRPLGVFLFAGPTGTGKTEIAKTLASFLFGSESRLVRLDMSELQTPESLERILGGTDKETTGGALIQRIRKQPFSVILLDEFEKAHPKVWDVFLQLFDDGRLTDPGGNTADFRNTIIILTSNLGSAIPMGASLGFQDESGRFSVAKVMREVEKSFRKEFLNRLDRVIVFRPLSRETMRGILRKELSEAFSRRGLRNRAWAVEWDQSAIEMLLRAGFTVDLGARPLRRAIEQHLLAPLALTIVNHQYPDGDQFLLVRAEGSKLEVEFVDPDAPDPDALAAGAAVERFAAVLPDEGREVRLSLEGIALEAKGATAEAEYLQSVWKRLEEQVGGDEWSTAKHDALGRMQESDFWDSADRFATLGFVEYVDRIEAGIRSAGSLIERLSGGGKIRARYPRVLLGRIAKQLFVLDEACRGVFAGRPREAFVQVEAWSDTGRPSQHADAFARRIGSMYRKWAENRRMPHESLREWGGDGQDAYGLLLAVSGYAAYALLEPESGLHVVEVPEQEGRGWHRSAVRVRVVPQPDAPLPRGCSPGDHARDIFECQDSPVSVVRRYREKPSPLVRDAVQGWRSGKLDRVLGGDFDLIARLRRSPQPDG